MNLGCHCPNTDDGSLFMTATTHGHPVDELDALCKEYRDCLKCAQAENPDAWSAQGGCEATRLEYNWDDASDSGEFCNFFINDKNNKKNQCRRDICECDVMFAKSKFGFQIKF